MDKKIKKVFTTWSGLTVKLVTKYFPKSTFTTKGHLRLSYKGTRSPKQDFLTTKTFPEVTVQPLEYTDNDKTDEFPHDHGFKTEHIFLKLYNASEKIYSDKIGRFTITSSKGSKYVMIIYEYDSNHIHRQPIKPCNAADLTIAY